MNSRPQVFTDTTPADDYVSGWSLVRAAARTADAAERLNRTAHYTLASNGALQEAGDDPGSATLAWDPGCGWRALVPAADSRSTLLDLYLPLCGATRRRPLTVGHLGQSLDGFIATHAGDSCFVTGRANILHLHRMRALCDAVIVGASTVEADNPRLTTRLASGENPLRVILDPSRRLRDDHAVFQDGAAPTLRASLVKDPPQTTRVAELSIPEVEGQMDLADLVRQLRARGCARIFVEGGGITVSAFLQRQLLDRLHIAVAPLLIGDGRAAVRLPPSTRLEQCLRPSARVFRMGQDVLYDCDVAARAPQPSGASDDTTLRRLF